MKTAGTAWGAVMKETQTGVCCSLFVSWLLKVPPTASLSSWLRCPPRERKIPGSNPDCDGNFPGRVIPVNQKLALQWLPCQASGVIGSALGLVGQASVYCDWVRYKAGSATSISVWQHVNLSEQIRP